MEDNEFLKTKEEMLLKIEETLEDTNKLIVRLIKLKFNLRNCQNYKDYLKYYPDSFDIEEGLKHITLFDKEDEQKRK